MNLALQPNDADTQCNLGIVLDRLGRRDEAVRAYQAALRINPALAPARQGLEARRP
jgi:Flp pilus assembly protein TadD